ncbi:hypothetical protein E2C01_089893 [Portunus trituberculatus]|uniref:Uncharacterized protein n=1 Tax=Portunus trituberculatus TaxID=210409 RepID=A0A5B7JK05_PORTR|nr:hypothetical protein [Portunus trituberculatus]
MTVLRTIKPSITGAPVELKRAGMTNKG